MPREAHPAAEPPSAGARQREGRSGAALVAASAAPLVPGASAGPVARGALAVPLLPAHRVRGRQAPQPAAAPEASWRSATAARILELAEGRRLAAAARRAEGPGAGLQKAAATAGACQAAWAARAAAAGGLRASLGQAWEGRVAVPPQVSPRQPPSPAVCRTAGSGGGQHQAAAAVPSAQAAAEARSTAGRRSALRVAVRPWGALAAARRAAAREAHRAPAYLLVRRAEAVKSRLRVHHWGVHPRTLGPQALRREAVALAGEWQTH